MVETEKLEFKRQSNDSIIKEVIAFCNTNGGTIIIGYDDNGKVYGLENAKKDLDAISDSIHAAISPDISFLVSLKIAQEEEKDIIIIEVLQGTNKPYYIKSKGMTSDGVYVRVGATTQKASESLIKEMIVESSGITFEKNLSINQELTFNYTEDVFKAKKLKFGKIEKKNLGLINENGKYTNLALLLSDQCPYTIKMAIYTNNTKTEFLDKKETSIGSILKQLEEAYEYLKVNNKTNAKIIGLERIETLEYSDEVLRECLLNSIGHRDYEIFGSNLVHIFKDCIEFLSLGGLVNGLTIEDIKIGSSASRNPKLINIFHRLGLVEAYGSGIPRILDIYRVSENQPKIVVAPHSFLITIPKLKIIPEYSTIIEYLRTNDGLTREKAEELLNTKKVKTLSILNKLINMQIIEKTGTSKEIIYNLKK